MGLTTRIVSAGNNSFELYTSISDSEVQDRISHRNILIHAPNGVKRMRNYLMAEHNNFYVPWNLRLQAEHRIHDGSGNIYTTYVACELLCPLPYLGGYSLKINIFVEWHSRRHADTVSIAGLALLTGFTCSLTSVRHYSLNA